MPVSTRRLLPKWVAHITAEAATRRRAYRKRMDGVTGQPDADSADPEDDDLQPDTASRQMTELLG